MSVVDAKEAFECFRRGHVASVGNLSGALVDYMTAFICACQRCGRVIEFDIEQLKDRGGHLRSGGETSGRGVPKPPDTPDRPDAIRDANGHGQPE